MHCIVIMTTKASIIVRVCFLFCWLYFLYGSITQHHRRHRLIVVISVQCRYNHNKYDDVRVSVLASSSLPWGFGAVYRSIVSKKKENQESRTLGKGGRQPDGIGN